MKKFMFLTTVIVGIFMVSTPTFADRAIAVSPHPNKPEPPYIKISTDSIRYDSGDKITVTTEVNRECHLWLDLINPNEEHKMLFSDFQLGIGTTELPSFPIKSSLLGKWRLHAECRSKTKTTQVSDNAAFELGHPRDWGRSFSIDIYGDQSIYEIGEKITLTVQADHDCYLSLYSINSDEQVRRLFPLAYEQNNFLRAGQNRQIPSNPEDFYFFTERPKVEIVYAICTKEEYNFLTDTYRTPREFERTVESKLQELPSHSWTVSRAAFGVLSDPFVTPDTSTVCVQVCNQDFRDEMLAFGVDNLVPDCAKVVTSGLSYVDGCIVSLIKSLGKKGLKNLELSWVGVRNADTCQI